jgi:hypothetical protein
MEWTIRDRDSKRREMAAWRVSVANSYSDADCYCYCHVYAYSHCYGNSYGNSNSNCYGYGNDSASDADGYSNSYSYGNDSASDGHANSDCNGDRLPWAFPDAEAEPDAASSPIVGNVFGGNSRDKLASSPPEGRSPARNAVVAGVSPAKLKL